MQVINFNKKIEGKRQATFIIFYSVDGKPWKDYPEIDKKRELVIPTCLMINRCDGRIGFPGGKVEEGENLEEAIKREVKEEIGYESITKIEEIVAHDIGSSCTHVFASKMTYEELKKVQQRAVLADHFGSELTGVFIAHLVDYDKLFGKGGGLINLLKSAFATSVREELVYFLLKKKLIKKDHLKIICDKAGYSLEELLG